MESFLARLKMTSPIIQAPMAGATPPALVAAVSETGALGSFAGGYLSADEIRKAIHDIKKQTRKAFAVNIFIPGPHFATPEQIVMAEEVVNICCPELQLTIKLTAPPYTPSLNAQLEVLLEEKISVVSFTFGILPKEWIAKLQAHDVILIGTATHLAEAKQLEVAGVDLIVAQGLEAGGHRGTFVGKAEAALFDTLSLTALLREQVQAPIIAAGGMMTGRHITAALAKGAVAVQLGTAFLSCPEAGIHPYYKQALLNARKDMTTLTRAFSGKLARGIDNLFIQRMKKFSHTFLDYPIQNRLTNPMRKAAALQNQINFMSLWAGQALHLSRGLNAKDLIKILHDEMK